MTTRDSNGHSSDAALERLLEEASPRPSPSDEAVARAKLAAHEEWQQVVGRRSWRRIGMFAAAATVVLAIALVMNPGPTPVPVLTATVDKTIGTVYLLGEDSTLTQLAEPDRFMTGQSVVTGERAGLGLTWIRGGSLRLDESTEIRFVSNERVELLSGRLYFDSQDTGAAHLTVETAHGDVTHIGTQFIVETRPERLTVSVREGSVRIDGHRFDETGYAGQAVTLRGDARPEKLDILRYGPRWEWVEITAPALEANSRTLASLLNWVSRETGLRIEFESPELRDDSLDDIFSDETLISDVPREALRQFLPAYDLDYEIRDGVIHIRQYGSP